MKKITLLFLILIAGFSILDAQVAKKILVEEFTQASCYPCAQLNPAFNVLLKANSNVAIPLKYQTNWPGIDPMNEQNPIDVRRRVDLYGVSGVPTAILNGGPLSSPEDVNQARINEEAMLTTPIEIKINHSIHKDYDSMTIQCIVRNNGLVSYDANNSVLHIALVEQEINFPTPPGSNGELDFSYVMRKMIPNVYGSPLFMLIPPGGSMVFNFTVSIPPYIYDLRQLGVVAFLQSFIDKTVEQAAYSAPVNLGNLEYYDLAMTTNTVFPAGYCNYDLNPAVNVQNQCNRIINSIKVAYRLNNGEITFTNWNGILNPKETTEIKFPVRAVTPGATILSYFLKQINNSLDSNNFNNQPKSESFITYEEKAFGTSFEENFESIADSGNPPHTIQIEKYANRIEVVSKSYFANTTKMIPKMGAYENSDKSLWIFMWNMLFGEQAALMYEKIDLSKNKKNKLTFDYAYCQSLGVENDKLDIQLSNDCGKTWTSIWSKAGKNLATTAPQNDNFFPFLPIATDWKSESVDLTAFQGQDGVNLRFLGTSAYGNNVYLDNIKVSGEVTAVDDQQADFDINIYPNPGVTQEPIFIQVQGSEIQKIKIYDLTGQLLYESVASIAVQKWTPSTSGIYSIVIYTDKGMRSKKISIFK